MARYGAKYIRWAPWAAEQTSTSSGFPSYGAAIALAELQKVSDTPNYSEASQYGDDGLQEYVNEFKDVDVDIEITDLPVETEKQVLGNTQAAKSGDVVICNAADNAPYGGLGFISCILRGNVRKYQAIIYPKLKAAMQGEEYSTKGDSLTLAGGKLKFKGAATDKGDWKLKSKYQDTEDAAKGILDGFFTGTVTRDSVT